MMNNLFCVICYQRTVTLARMLDAHASAQSEERFWHSKPLLGAAADEPEQRSERLRGSWRSTIGLTAFQQYFSDQQTLVIASKY